MSDVFVYYFGIVCFRSTLAFVCVCRCWMNESPYTMVLSIPVCASMVLNLIFLCNILRVLLIKLRAGPRVGSSRPSSTLLQVCYYRLLSAYKFQRNDVRFICSRNNQHYALKFYHSFIQYTGSHMFRQWSAIIR
jgi:hypothetical protein